MLQLVNSCQGSEILVLTGLAGFNRTFSRHGSLSQLLSSYQLQAYQLPGKILTSSQLNA